MNMLMNVVKVGLLALVASSALAQSRPVLQPESCLVIPSVGRGGRAALHTDAIEAQLVAGTFKPPSAGDTVEDPAGPQRAWRESTINADGHIENEAARTGYSFVPVPCESERIVWLEIAGDTVVYVNGAPRAGDPYATGKLRLPIKLNAGDNGLLIKGSGRGGPSLRLLEPTGPVTFDPRDITVPDLLVGEPVDVRLGVIVVNATDAPLERGEVSARLEPDGEPVITKLPVIPPLSIRKVPVRVKADAQRVTAVRSVTLRLESLGDVATQPAPEARVEIDVRDPRTPHRRTFISEIDGSVQYYAVQPATPLPGDATLPALFLSLHGASVEASGQAAAYSPKTWSVLVAPTNRRPFGFDWEDWGRIDALEVLGLARKQYRTDPTRTYLTGHSMGGHGVWRLGALYPDHFAAIGPSAGWISFESYTGAPRYDDAGPFGAMLNRAAASSDTLLMLHNYLHFGIYILHGDADDNVPVTQARDMRDKLKDIHNDLSYYERPGAGHWWDGLPEEGAACVDWGPMFDLFARHVIPASEAVRKIDFTTVNPAISAESHWLRIEAQHVAMAPSNAWIRLDPGRRWYYGLTSNVERLSLDLSVLAPGSPVYVQLDQQIETKFDWPTDGSTRLTLMHDGTQNWWSPAEPAGPSVKNPDRGGPFKQAFNNHMLFVYGTKGDAAENAWALAKARFDAETFLYRGNGSIDVIADTEFESAAAGDRNVILYGNKDTNAAWDDVLGTCPVYVTSGLITLREHMYKSDDLAVLFVYPRRGSDHALVGVVGGTGVVGMRLTDRLPCFVSGVHYPDAIVLSPAFLTASEELPAEDDDEADSKLRPEPVGIKAAGFFGNDWSIENGDFAFEEQDAQPK